MSAFAQGTAFTYQGQLSSGGSPANGTYDVQFTLFSVGSGGSAIGSPAVKTGLGITNGLFTTALDFGTVFNGTTNWLELAVRTNGASSFSPPLTPRQQLTPTPYAVYAESANASNLVGTIPAANLSGAALLAGGNAFTGVQTVTGGNSSGGAPALIISGPGGPEVSYTSTTGGLGWDLYAANNGYSISRHGIDFPFQIDGASGNSLFSHNVGIGTTTPNSSLAVVGNLFFGQERPNTTFNQIGDTLYLGAEQKYLANTLLSPVDGTTDWINLMANPVSAGIMFGLSGSSTTNPHSNTVPLMVIRPNGNVGIGATNPSTALQVNGTVTATAFSGDGSSLTNVALLNQQNTFTAQQTFKTGPGTYGCVVTDGTNQLGSYIAQGQCSFGTITSHALGFFVNNGFDSMVLDLNGHLGIGTTTPNSDSSLQVKGLVRMGSETGTTEAPTRPIMFRRINSSETATGTEVARSLTAGAGVITLERDGTSGGLVLKATGSVGDAEIVGFGINTSSAVVTTQSIFYGGTTASYQVFTDAQKISYLRISFGDAANPADFTTVEAMRAVDNLGNNLSSWIGTVTSTVNQ